MLSDDFGKSLDGLSAIVVAVYLFFVWYQGNTEPFIKALFQPANVGYLEFLIALFILWQILSIDSLQPASGMLVFGAVLAVFVKAAATSGSGSAWAQFGNGQIGLFGLMSAILGKGK